MKKNQRAKPGPKPRPPEDRASESINLRVSPRFKRALKEAAQSEGYNVVCGKWMKRYVCQILANEIGYTGAV